MASQMLGEPSFPGIATSILLTCSVQAEKNKPWLRSEPVHSPYIWSASCENTPDSHTQKYTANYLHETGEPSLQTQLKKWKSLHIQKKASLLETRMNNFASWRENNSTCNCNFYPMGSIGSQSGEKNFQQSLLQSSSRWVIKTWLSSVLSPLPCYGCESNSTTPVLFLKVFNLYCFHLWFILVEYTLPSQSQVRNTMLFWSWHIKFSYAATGDRFIN